MATYWENSCSFGLRYVSWYKYLTVNLVFSHLGFWSGNLFLIAPFPDLCLLVPFYYGKKNSKIFFSETTGPTALIFCMWQWLMVLYINCASHAPGVKFGHAPGVDSLHRLTIGKTKKIFFSETTRPTALIFGM